MTPDDDNIFGGEEEPATAPAPAPAPTAAPMTPAKALDELAAEGQKLKLDEAPKAEKKSQVEKAELVMEKLFEKGSIIKLTVGGWTAEKKLTHKDLGKKKEDVPDEIVNLGKKRLLKKSCFEKLRSIESKSRSLVDNHSHEAWIPGLRFMTTAAKKLIMDELKDLQKDYFQAAEEFVKQYPEMKEQTLKEFPQWADKLEPFYPAVEKVKGSFKFEINEFEVTIPKKTTQIFESAKIELKQDLSEKLNKFLLETVHDTRQLFIEELTAIKSKLDGGDKVHARTVKKIHEMIETAKAANFVDDKEFFTLLETFKSNFDKEKMEDPTNKKKVAEQLAEILATAGNEEKTTEVVEKYKRSLIV